MPPHKSYIRCEGISLSESAANKLTDKSLKWGDRKPIGFHFNPNDRALARILVDKLFRPTGNIVLKLIRDRNVYEHEPSNLPNDGQEFGEGKLYFFTPIQKKYGKGKIIKRTVPGGLWQKTGSDSSIEIEVKDSSIEKLSITKTSLEFYKRDEKSGKKKKTSLLMKQYMLETQSYENFVNSDKIVALCVIYSVDDGKQIQYDESGTRSVSFGEGSEQRSIPNRMVGSSQVCASISASSSFLPPTPIQNYLNPYCTQNLSMHFADQGNPRKRHFPFSTLQQGPPIFPNSEQNVVMGSQGATYRSSFPEPVSGTRLDQHIQDLGKSLDSFTDNLPSQQPDFMHDQPQPDPCENSISIVSSWLQSGNEHGSNQQQQPISHSSCDQIIQQQPSDSYQHFADQGNPRKCHFPLYTPLHEKFGNFSNNPLHHNSKPGMITHQLGNSIFLNSEQTVVTGSQGATYGSSFPESVSGTHFDLQIQDLGQSLDSFTDNLPNQQLDFMDDQPQPDPCENSISIVCPPSNTIKNNNLLDPNENLNHNIYVFRDPNGALLSPVFNESFMFSPELLVDSSRLHSGNEHGSNEQQQPNSHSLCDQIVQLQPSDSAMTWNPSQQNPVGKTLTSLQPFDHHPIFD